MAPGGAGACAAWPPSSRRRSARRRRPRRQAIPSPLRQTRPAREILPLPRTACLDVAADTLLAGIEARVDAVGAGVLSARPAALREFERALRRDQDAWRDAMETRCSEAGAGIPTRGAAHLRRARCRLGAARARERRLRGIEDRIAAAEGRASPRRDCVLTLFLDPLWRPRPRRPVVECDLGDVLPESGVPER